MKTTHGYTGTNAILIGNSIGSQKAEIRDHTIVVNYVDRNPWQGLAILPSIQRSRVFFVEKGELKEKPFPRLTAETAMKLAMQDWAGCTAKSNGKLSANVMDGKGGLVYVESLCDELNDNRLKAEKRIAQARYQDGVWSLGGILLHEYSCQPNHGHEHFSTETCQ
jgi:hypothetical protein